VTRIGFLGGVSRFWGELRRRKVVKVALVYLAAAWIIIEVASVVFPELMLPDWSVRLLIVLAAAGFPLAVVLAWVFDITPQGVLRTPPAVAGPPEARAPATRPAPPERSLAVLPFRNIGGERDNEYFVDGLAEDILILLARVEGLRVAARSSSFAFRDGDAREIGTRLNVASVLEGSVRKAGNQLRITVRLVDTVDGYQRWSQAFDRQVGDIFELQGEIASAVFDALEVEVYNTRRPQARPGTRDIEAYNLYLMGRHQFHKRSEASLNKAVEFFRQATERDPQFALPYTGLADAWALLGNSGEGYGRLPVAKAIACAEPMVERALQLAPRLAEAHASRGFIDRLRLDFPASERALRRALELNPQYPLAHVWLGLTLSDIGKLREAREAFQRAYASDPLSPIVGTNLGFSHMQFGDHEAARECFQRVLAIAPEFPVAHAGLAYLERDLGLFAEAQRHWERAAELAPERANYPACLAMLQLERENPAAAAPFLEQAEAISPQHPVVRRARISVLIATGQDAGLLRYADALTADDEPGEEAFANAGLARLVAGQPRLALEAYAQAGTDLQYWLKDSLVWSWRFAHGLHHADALLQTGQREQGLAALDAAKALFVALEAEGLVNPELDYQRAVVLALRGEYEEGARAFDRALQRGWRRHWWARRDPGLAALRKQGLLSFTAPSGARAHPNK
jgi:TolB-like protein/Flp pilus assembly protein TadD